MSAHDAVIPLGLCQCGCGESAPVAERTHTRYGYVKGQPKRYIRGHATRGKPVSVETRQRLREAMTGRDHTWGHKISAAQRGEAGPSWTGGRIVREGRVLVYVGREHPMADTYGYVYEHRLVLASAMGRTLPSAVSVHHVDCDPANNALHNLVALGHPDHMRVHHAMRRGLSPYDALHEVFVP